MASVAPSHIVINIVNNMRRNKQDVVDECIKYNKVDTNTKALLEKTQLRKAS